MRKDFIYNIKRNLFNIILLTYMFTNVIINIVIKNSNRGDIVGTTTI